MGVLATHLEIVKHELLATGKECKTKTLQRVKVQDEIMQYIERVQHEKSAT